MTKSRVLEKLRAGEVVRTAGISRVTSPWLTELVGKLGYDLIWLDMEHREFGYDVIPLISLGCRATGMDLMVRILKTGYSSIMRALEFGANGIIVPHCRTAQEARQWADWCRFPPLGTRGFDGAGVDADYMLAHPLDYIKHANEETFQQAGHPERIGYYEDSSSGHGYQQKKREAAYGWFLKWLMERGDGQPYAEPATQTVAENDPELRCFPAGENHALGPGLMAAVRKMASDLPPGSPSKSLDDVLGKLPQQPPFPLTIRDMSVQRLEIPSEDAIRIPAFLVMPQGALRGVLFAVDDKGKEALTGDPILRDALAGGWALCGLDPRGIGESANDKMGWVYEVSTLLGGNFIWRQGWDIRHTVQSVAASAPLAGRPALIYARGHDAALAATYALAQGMNVRAAILREGFLSFHQFVDRPKSTTLSYRLIDEDRDRLTAYDREIPFPYFVFNGLRSFDLPQLLKSAPAKILVVDPMDGDWERMTTAAAREIVGNRVQVVSNGDPQSAVRALLREVH